MYQRVMNRLDAEIFAEELEKQGIEQIVVSRMKEVVATLDDAYGMYRSFKSMGGYILFFKDEVSYKKTFEQIMSFYNLDKELYEYSDCISERQDTGVEWWEELYLLSSEDSLVLIHPKNN